MKKIIAAFLLLFLSAGASLACECDPAWSIIMKIPNRLTEPWDPPKKADESKGSGQQTKQDSAPKAAEPRLDTAPSGAGQK